MGSWLAPAAAGFAASAAALGLRRWRFPLLLTLLGLGLGIARIAAAPIAPPPGDLAELAGRTVSGTGIVESYPRSGSGRQQAVVAVTSAGRHGRTIVYTDPYPELAPGDVLALHGKISRPEPLDGFDYPKYLGKDGIYTVMYRPRFSVTGHRTMPGGIAYPLRRAFLGRLAAAFNEPAAGFLAAILIGDQTGLPDSITAAFRQTGTIHVMALSGYNISILIAALIALLGRRRGVIGAMFALIAAFVIFVGPTASVVRAALMGSFLLFGQALGRPQEAVLACVITGAAMLLVQPWALRYDLGFDLSFLATIGILIFEPAVAARLQWMPELLRDVVSPTIAASLPAMPVIAASFGTVSLIAPVANVAIVPLVPWLMLGGFVVALTGFISGVLAAVLAVPVQLVTDLALRAIVALSRVPFAYVHLNAWRLPFIAVTTALGLGLLVYLKRPAHA